MKAKYKLKEAKDYLYLNRFLYNGKSSPSDLLRLEAGPADDPRDDGKKFSQVLEKFADLSTFSEEDVDEIMSIVAGILKLGNVEIVGDDDKSCIKDKAQLAEAAELFKVSPEMLEKAICHETKQIPSRGAVVLDKSKRKAEMQRNALAKTVYDDLFVDFVCKGISADIRDQADVENNNFIGILDIFGFEFTPEDQMAPTPEGGLCNSLEQFCINLCNEQLQNHFVNCVFKQENKTYKNELGYIPELKFTTNDETLKVLSTGKASVMSELVSMALMGGDDRDVKLCASIDSHLSKLKDQDGKAIIIKPKKMAKNVRHMQEYLFQVAHYAGEVMYSTNLWMDKDVNKLTSDGSTCFASSGLTRWLSGFYDAKLQSDACGPKTISETFKLSLQNLMSVLESTQTNFVRCIKPRMRLEDVKSGYQGCYVLNQLKYTGMLATLKIRKLGYPVRLDHKYFHDKYRVLNPNAGDHDALVQWIKGQPFYHVANEAGVGAGPDGNDDIKVGSTKVLIRDDLVRSMDIERNRILEVKVVVIQAAYRASSEMQDYSTKVAATSALVPLIRSTLSMIDYLQKKWSHIDMVSRTSLVTRIRASLCRTAYYHQRVGFFEGVNRQDICRYIQATVQRQRYYEMKELYMMQQVTNMERERFAIYDVKSMEYFDELAAEAVGEKEEREMVAEEDKYMLKIVQARIEEAYAQMKNSIIFEVEEYYKRAAVAAIHYRGLAQSASDIESKYQQFQQQMDEGAHKRVYMLLKEEYDELGHTELYPYEDGRAPSDSRLTLVAPPLRPLPPDMDSVVMMKRYIHKGKPPRKDLSEGFEIESLAPAAPVPESPVVEKAKPVAPTGLKGEPSSLELSLSVDPTKLSQDEQVKFLNEVAKIMNVDPSTLSIHSLKVSSDS